MMDAQKFCNSETKPVNNIPIYIVDYTTLTDILGKRPALLL